MPIDRELNGQMGNIFCRAVGERGRSESGMRVREKPLRFLPACPKKKPRTHPGPDKREKRIAGFLKAQREALPT